GHQEEVPLVAVRADQQVDPGAGSGSDALDRTRGDDVPVDHRLPEDPAYRHLAAPARGVGIRDEVGLQLRLGLEPAIRGNRGHPLASGFDAELLREALADPLRRLDRDHRLGSPALGDGAPEQPFGTRHRQQHADAHRARRLPEDGHLAGITTEGGNILLYPLEGGNLVEQPEVGGAVPKIEEAVGTRPIVDGHADDAVPGEPAALIPGRRSVLKHPARDPDHHRVPGRPEVGGPDIEVQAVRTGVGRLWDEHVPSRGIGHRGRLRAVAEGVAHAAPGLHRLWRAEAIGAKRRRRVGNALEGRDAIGDAAAYRTRPGLHNAIHSRASSYVMDAAPNGRGAELPLVVLVCWAGPGQFFASLRYDRCERLSP